MDKSAIKLLKYIHYRRPTPHKEHPLTQVNSCSQNYNHVSTCPATSMAMRGTQQLLLHALDNHYYTKENEQKTYNILPDQ
jgi:hypothetical protein